MRVCLFAIKADARNQVRAINLHYMQQARTVVRGRHAPADPTARHVALEQYAGGAWGHRVTAFVRSIDGLTIGNSPQHVISLAGEVDMPETTVSLPGHPATVVAPIAIDVAGSDSP